MIAKGLVKWVWPGLPEGCVEKGIVKKLELSLNLNLTLIKKIPFQLFEKM